MDIAQVVPKLFTMSRDKRSTMRFETNHKINYPQSRMFRESSISERHFLVLGHCADQTHKKLYHKSQQGERCMRLVDYDRCLQAQDQGYTVSVAKLVPSDCTPKNNLLVGVPHNC